MSRAAFGFRSVCRDLADHEHSAIAGQLQKLCPPGTSEEYQNYAYRLYWLARTIGATKIVELGVAGGASTLPLLLAAGKTGGRLWSCDLGVFGLETVSAYPVDTSRWERVEGTRADHFGQAWSVGLVDMVYLDTIHTYEDTALEIAAWWPHVREGGLFVFHDVESGRGTVFRAIAEAMIAKKGVSVEYHHFPDCHGHGVLQWFNDVSTNSSVVGLSTLLGEASR